jgi:hypothetical protein
MSEWSISRHSLWYHLATLSPYLEFNRIIYRVMHLIDAMVRLFTIFIHYHCPFFFFLLFGATDWLTCWYTVYHIIIIIIIIYHYYYYYHYYYHRYSYFIHCVWTKCSSFSPFFYLPPKVKQGNNSNSTCCSSSCLNYILFIYIYTYASSLYICINMIALLQLPIYLTIYLCDNNNNNKNNNNIDGLF